MRCKFCGAEIEKPYREWDATPRKKPSEIRIKISCWECPSCGKKFRTATRVWPEKKPKARGRAKARGKRKGPGRRKKRGKN
ncbi:MAG: hypothetical protein ACXQTQ_02530 [Candidatus Hecatellaceae archaeon]|nr:MAG: hypothetical protein DRO46_05125 [Candidatus Hecatellales archaeon]